jgi:hypothetical protein
MRRGLEGARARLGWRGRSLFIPGAPRGGGDLGGSEEVPTRAAPAADRALPQPEGNAALARTIREASARAAAVDVEEANELADLALFTARLVPGGEAQRNRAVGFCDGATLKKPVL